MITNLAFAFLDVYLISQYHEREVLRIMRASLNKKFVAPAVECLEGLRAIHIIDKHTTVCSTVECDTERLETFLTSGVPELVVARVVIQGRLFHKLRERTCIVTSLSSTITSFVRLFWCSGQFSEPASSFCE
jgi:hypothetical protein